MKLGFKKGLRVNRIRRKVTAINLQLLELEFTNAQIMDFWEECLAVATIQHQLPPCKCKDVNKCETWCQANARFAMNPPED